MLECFGCSREKLSDPVLVTSALEEFPGKIGMKKISPPYVFSCKAEGAGAAGVTGVVLIEESHISVHTFPGEAKAFIDIFSCREFDINSAVSYMMGLFGAEDHKAEIFSRGFQFLGDLGRSGEALAGEVKR
jgi:S-adenosylmethionine decarboxylase